jgi:hypothetical protein
MFAMGVLDVLDMSGVLGAIDANPSLRISATPAVALPSI